MTRAPRALLLALLLNTAALAAQQPRSWQDGPRFGTFSIVAVDPATGESGVAVTTRVPCVGNAVPHVRAGVGAVATQAFTRVEYGAELLDLLAAGTTPAAALTAAVAADSLAEERQVGVIALDGAAAQHTGGDANSWAGHRAGPNYATQGNLLVGPQVLAAVASAFEASAASGRHLADRLIEALAAGDSAGGDARKGRLQSTAVVVADPRPGRSRRPDGVTADINVCEHARPIAELRRIYDTISGTLGYRTVQQYQGADIWQLRVMLHALGYHRPELPELSRTAEGFLYTAELVEAVDRFRGDQGLSTPALGSPPGLVDGELVALLWHELERAGKAAQVRRQLHDLLQVRR
ncbi:MAG: DUF1028 domain-containing protein [Longimicrobiales bacterium]